MKERLDVLVVERRLADSREKAKAIIMAGNVFVNGQREDKAGSMFDVTSQIEIHGVTMKYVSRGGLKLEKAMTHFDISLEGRVCMDVGASTGGFTDCMLQNGAVKVYSVDVGHGQLDWRLRQDERVVVMEKTNIKFVTPEDIADVIDFASIDVSFISLTKVLLPVRALLRDGGEVAALIKPQFEAGREKVGKKGVVRDKAVHIEVIENVTAFAAANGFLVRSRGLGDVYKRQVHIEVIENVTAFAAANGFIPLNLEFSPIKGPEGNIEYLLHLRKSDEEPGELPFNIREIVEKAHEML